MSALQRAMDLSGGPVRLAAKLGISTQRLCNWNGERRRVPIVWCPAIERAVGGAVRCDELRPDFAWQMLRDPVEA